MKYAKSLTALALIGSAFSLSACGSSNGTSNEAAPTVAPVEKKQPAAAPEENKSSRGNLIMKPGQVGTVKDSASDKETVKFTVNSIKPIKCTEPYAQPAENGNIYAVDLTLTTTPALAESAFPKYTISGYDFKFIAPNGTTFNGQLAGMATYGCIPDAEEFPMAGVGPDEKVRAKVILDLPDTKGTLVMKSLFGSGYEYSL